MIMKESERDELLIRIDERTERMEKAVTDHETRIRCVEGNFFKMLTVAGFIGFISGWFGKTFGGS
jgi:hypothetical protein